MNRWCGWLLCSVLFCSGALAQAAELDRVRIASEAWPGHTNADGSGLAWDIFRKVFEPVGVQLAIQSVPYTRSIGLVQRGEADAWVEGRSIAEWDVAAAALIARLIAATFASWFLGSGSISCKSFTPSPRTSSMSCSLWSTVKSRKARESSIIKSEASHVDISVMPASSRTRR